MHNHEAPGKSFRSYKWLLLPLHPIYIRLADYVYGIAVECDKYFALYSIG